MMYRAHTEYVDCYTVSSHGDLETRPWIYHFNTTELTDSTVEERWLSALINTGDGDTGVVMELMRDIVFRQTDSVPACISQPERSQSCLKYVALEETLPALQPAGNHLHNYHGSHTGRHNDSIPPPVPAKPRHHLSVTSPVLKACSLTPRISYTTTEHSDVHSESDGHDRHKVTASDEVTTANDELFTSLRCEKNIEVTSAASDEPSVSLRREEKISDNEILASDTNADEAVLKRLSSNRRNMIDSCVDYRLTDSECENVSYSTTSLSLSPSLTCNGDNYDNDGPADHSLTQQGVINKQYVVDTAADCSSEQHPSNNTATPTDIERLYSFVRKKAHHHHHQQQHLPGRTQRCGSVVETGSETEKLSMESIGQRFTALKEAVGYDGAEIPCSRNSVDAASCGSDQSNNGPLISSPALFYSSVKCTGAPKYPYKDILVHRCTSPMNKTTHPCLSVVTSPSLITSPLCAHMKAPSSAVSVIADNTRDTLSHSNDVNVTLNSSGDDVASDAVTSLDTAAAVSTTPHCRLVNSHVMTRGSLQPVNPTSDAVSSAPQCNVVVMTRGSLLLVNPRSLVISNDQCDCFAGTVLSYDVLGNAFYVPAVDLRCYGDPCNEPWFYPIPLTPLQATVLLSTRHTEPGSFLVYCGCTHDDSAQQYSLAVCAGPDVLHYGIVRNVLGDLSIQGHRHSFVTLSELVRYFQRNKSSLVTRLARPLSVTVTARLEYHEKYELARSQLRLSGNIIGNGRYGVICVGKYRGQPVAVKVLSLCQFVVYTLRLIIQTSYDFS